MEKHYFITVRTYKSVNSMGQQLADYVEKEYNHVVVSAENFKDIVFDIKKKMEDLQKIHTRCRPFLFNSYKTKGRYNDGEEHLYVKPDSTYNDNVVFSLETTVVRNELTVRSLDV